LLAVALSIAAATMIGASAPPASGASPLIGAGARQYTVGVGGVNLSLFTYRPRCANPVLLLVFHGLGRNADGYRDHARPLADHLCMLVVAPLFDTTSVAASSMKAPFNRRMPGPAKSCLRLLIGCAARRAEISTIT
jgi:poly(3-hydroxybutyrate) depolymerase